MRCFIRADPNLHNNEGFTPFLLAVKKNQKKAVSHSFILNKQLANRNNPIGGSTEQKRKPKRIEFTRPNKLTGKNCFHYASEVPSLLMIIDLAKENSAGIISVDNYFNLASKSVPFVNLTSRKYTLKLEQREAREHLYSPAFNVDEDFDFFSFDAEPGDFASSQTRVELKNTTFERSNFRRGLRLRLRPHEDGIGQHKKSLETSKLAFKLDRPLLSNSRGLQAVNISKPAAGFRPFPRITMNCKKTLGANAFSTRDPQDTSDSSPSKSFNSGSPTRSNKVSLEFGLRMHGDKLFETQVEKLKQVASVHPRISWL